MITVEVTEGCIRRGVRNHPWRCPVALAVKKVLPRGNVRIGETAAQIKFAGEESDNYYWLSERVSRFIRRFDAKRPVKPFKFRLDVDAPKPRTRISKRKRT